MKKDFRVLIAKIVVINLFVPLLIILMLAFNGKSIEEAILNCTSIFTTFPELAFPWIIILLFNLFVLLVLHPVIIFWKKFLHKKDISNQLATRAMDSLNSFRFKITIFAVLGFTAANLHRSIDIYNNFEDLIPSSFTLLEGVIIGLFSAAFINMSLENTFYEIKKSVMLQAPSIKPNFRSYYKNLSYIIILLILFLGFQVFHIASDFYMVFNGSLRDNLILRFGENAEMSPEIMLSKFGRTHQELGSLLNVLVIKLLAYILLSVRIIVLLKNRLKTPLVTVEDKLKSLTYNNATATDRIDSYDNNEFTNIYSYINDLISKQRVDLENSRRRLHTIIDNAGDAIVSFKESGRIFIFNPAAERLFGWTWEEVQGMPFTALFDQNNSFCKICGSDHSKFVQMLTDRENVLKRYTGVTKSGDNIIFEANISQSNTHEGVLFTAILRDISRQIEFEEQLKGSKVAAERANRLKSEFLANMSHELRTPLNAILGFTQLLNSDKNLTDDQLDKLSIVSRSGEHLLGLINDILDISKIEAGKIELHNASFNLKNFTNDIKEMFELRCKKKNLALYVEYVDPLPQYLSCDLGKLRQILINIVGNAIKFTKEGGISIVVGIKDNKLRFSVNDTGKGIPKSEISNILQPFVQSTTNDHEGGTGLGLSITKSFIEMMGGNLEIESQIGVGSTFTFSVDFEYTDKLETEDVVEGDILGIEGDKHPVAIVVDDKIENRLILKEMLERVGFVTIEAANGREAIERSLENRTEMIFMDIKMPVMDGYEAVGKIKSMAELKDIPTIALTASAFKHDKKSILDSGFDGFVAKPFKQSVLIKAIEDCSSIRFIYDIKTEHSDKLLVKELDYGKIHTSLAEISEDIITNLDDLALINDFVGIKSIIEPLKGNVDLREFISLVEFYVGNFDDENLLELLSKIKNIG